MSTPIELAIGQTTWRITVPPESQVVLEHVPQPAPHASPRELVRAALETPFGFDSPLRRALTPDDHVAIVLDERLPHVAELLAAVIEHLGTAGVPPEAITVLVTRSEAGSPWVDDLPDEYADIKLEVHDPEDQKKLAYLATTKKGHRIYLNRTLVEADFVLVLSGRRFDPTFGHGGAESAIFPALGDPESIAGLVGKFSIDPTGTGQPAVTEESAQVAWLLGTPFFVQVIEGAGDTIQDVVAGLPDCTEEGVRRHDARWRSTITDRPDLVIAAVSGSPERIDFLDLASAAATAARIVRVGGRVAVLSTAAPALLEGAELVHTADEPAEVGKLLRKRKPDDWPAAALWASAAERASLFVAAGWPEEVTEGLFATPLHSAAEVQRLVDAAERVLVIPDAHKSLVELS
jgi:nickel-dependent lactate racemase